MSPTRSPEWPLPDFYSGEKVKEIWNVPYQERAVQAKNWAQKYQIQPAYMDKQKIALFIIDAQNSFCIPGFELFVAGRSGLGAVDDNRRLCEFIYRNLGSLTQIIATLDTHTAMQIFHPIFIVDRQGQHPAPHTTISYDDLKSSRWGFNPEISKTLGISNEFGQQHLLHYAEKLSQNGKYDLTIWPYHVMQGSIGNALVASVEEAIFFHTICRSQQAHLMPKGDNPFTEHYSAIGPEVRTDPQGQILAKKNQEFVKMLKMHDAIVIAGQAKSHCVAWTVADLLDEIQKNDPTLADKVYLLEDCTSPVVVPGIVDYTEQANMAFKRFSQAGMHIVRSTDPLHEWPNLNKTAT